MTKNKRQVQDAAEHDVEEQPPRPTQDSAPQDAPGVAPAQTAADRREKDVPPAAGDGVDTPVEPHRPPRSGVALALLSLLLVIAAAGGGFAVWRQVTDRQQSLAADIERARNGLQTTGGRLDDLSSAVQSLKSSVASSQIADQEKLAKRVAAVENTAGSNGQTLNTVRDTLSGLQASVQSLQTSLQSLSNQVKSGNDKLSARLQGALGDIHKTQQSLQASVDKLRDQVAKRADRWMIGDAEYLIRVAGQHLQLTGDAHAAMTALQAAEQRLRDVGDPSLLDVRKKLTDDIVALRSVPDVDITGMALTLSDLSGGVDQLPLAGRHPESVTPRAGGAPQSGWREFLHRLWTQIKSLVVVRHQGGDAAALVPPDQEFFLRQNLKLKLEASRLALLRKDDKTFDDALSTAEQWLTQYFAKDSPAVTGMQKSLERLAATRLRPPLPDLSGTLKSLRDWEATHGDKTAASGAGRVGPAAGAA